ncbi:MAG: M50 family metallopeptidase [Anaerolineales bacterium]|nr:M50 family metallopeptidase [Anaerolineales bacterium]
MQSGFLTLIVFFFALSGMIFIHELGHFIAARLVGIEVEEFGFGLPSYKLATLFKWRGTEFTIHALPLGGFVRPKGENDPNVPGGYGSAGPWRRLIVLVAGPMMNLLTAIVVFSALTAYQGMPLEGKVKIDSVAENSPAQYAGIQTGDVIVSINGEETPTVDSAIAFVRANLDQPLAIIVDRNGELITLNATPLSNRTAQEGALGVGLTTPTRPATLTESLGAGVLLTAIQAVTIVYLPVALIQGVIAPDEARLVGFKGIYDLFDYSVQEDVSSRQEAAQVQASSGGGSAPKPTNFTLNLIGMLSVSLGVLNLFPIPALDGGRILFTLPEILFRKRVPAQWENAVNGIAMLLLIGIMLFVNVMDFVKPANLIP